MKPINLKFCASFKINIQKREGLSNLKNRAFLFFSTISKKGRFQNKIKSVSMDTQIK